MKKLNVCLLLIWMIVIFFLSNQDSIHSQRLSDGVIEKSVNVVVNITNKNITEKEKSRIIENYSGVVRKMAHFTEFLILGLLVINVLKDYYKLNYKILLQGIIFCVLYALFDEMHQMLIAGRAARIFDVFIDSSGGSLGSFILYIIKKTNKLIFSGYSSNR